MADRRRVLGENGRKLTLNGYVGFDSLPNQLVNIRKAQGFTFNLLVVGESGIGKHTLVDSLFKTSFDHEPLEKPAAEVSLTSHSYDVSENGVDLRLTIIHTRAFGDQINKGVGVKPITDFIDARFQEYLAQELKPSRDIKSFRDTRVHAALYLITPTGHSIKSLDLQALQALHTRVNVIPVIAKSDTISRSELQDFKQRILDELSDNDIKVYTFPVDDTDDVAKLNEKLNAEVPFAVVGSRQEANMGGQKVRVRQYPWGIVEVENEAHSDFPKLREMLIRTNIEDLVSRMHNEHYERYRQANLLKLGYSADGDANLSDAFKKKKEDHERGLARIEEELRQSFVAKVKEKDVELQRAGLELNQRFEGHMRNVKQQFKELEEQEKRLNQEIEHLRAQSAAAAADPKDKKNKKTK